VLPYVFPVLFPLGLMGLAGLCIIARRAMSRSENASTGRAALLMAFTRVPIAPVVPPRAEESENGASGAIGTDVRQPR